MTDLTLRKAQIHIRLDVAMPSASEQDFDYLEAAAALLGNAVRVSAESFLLADVLKLETEIDWTK